MVNPAPLARYREVDPANDMPSSTIRKLWGPGNGDPYSKQRVLKSRSKVALYTGAEIVGGVHQSMVPAVQAMSHVMALHRYQPVHPGNWGVSYRRVRGGKSWSLHAFGCAVDIGAPANPFVRSFVTDMPPELISDLMGISTFATGDRVWTWGGFWGVRGHRRSDAMHFQANCGPNAMGGGVVCPDGTTFLPGHVSNKPSPSAKLGITPRVLSIGSKHSEVGDIQKVLIKQGLLSKKLANSSFGPETRKAVLAWQTRIGVVADGIWGPLTKRKTGEWLAKLGKVSSPKEEIRTSVGAVEAEAIVDRAYARALGRAAEPGGKEYWMKAVGSRGYSELELVALFHASDEGRARSRRLADVLVSASADYLTALFKHREGVEPTEAQLAIGTARLSAFASDLHIAAG